MGGNVVIDGISPGPITISTQQDRDSILNTVNHICNYVNRLSGYALWPCGTEISRLAAGSTAFLYDRSISTDDLIRAKHVFGDIDIQFDGTKRDELLAVLFRMVNDTTPGFELAGFKTSIDTVVTLWRADGRADPIQIDFEAEEFVSGLPSEWARFGHSSHWSDAEEGIKGFAHKYIFRAITAIWLTEIRHRLATKTVTKTVSPIVFSPKGARVKWKEIEPEIWSEIPMYESTLVRNVPELFELFFETIPSSDDLEKMYSFVGVVGLIKQYIDKSKHQAIMDGMLNLLWGPNAQKLYRNAPTSDYLAKITIVYYMLDHLSCDCDAPQYCQEFYRSY